MICLLKRILPFILTLSLGLVLGKVLTRPSFRTDATALVLTRVDTTPLSILSVPEIDFTEEARRTTNILSGSLRVQASLGADGKVSDVKLIGTFPAANFTLVDKKGELVRPTSAILNDKFIDSLPQELIEASIEATKQIQFIPATKDGKPISSSVTAVYEFYLIASPDCITCSEINITITDNGGLRWQKRMARENAYSHYDFYGRYIEPGSVKMKR